VFPLRCSRLARFGSFSKRSSRFVSTSSYSPHFVDLSLARPPPRLPCSAQLYFALCHLTHLPLAYLGTKKNQKEKEKRSSLNCSCFINLYRYIDIYVFIKGRTPLDLHCSHILWLILELTLHVYVHQTADWKKQMKSNYLHIFVFVVWLNNHVLFNPFEPMAQLTTTSCKLANNMAIILITRSRIANIDYHNYQGARRQL